jgi:SAM-dependent methyltransferase
MVLGGDVDADERRDARVDVVEHARPLAANRSMFLLALTTSLSAFLLFSVQPLIAKQIVPWFGGTSAVWTLCLVFFQSLLTAGYAYSDWTTRRLGRRSQAALHVALLALSLVSLPIVAGDRWKPAGGEEPSWRILGLLATTIGLPYFLLSTTSPLVQTWFARRFPHRAAYRLFALSNLASLAALVSYPFAVEPWVPTRIQALVWSAGYVGFVVLCAAALIQNLRHLQRAARPEPFDSPLTLSLSKDERATTDDAPDPSAAELRAADQLLWFALPAMSSWLLLAVTNHITQNVAAIPFLWLLPLALYLVTFIIAFDHGRWYQRELFVLPMLGLLVACAMRLPDSDLDPDIRIAIPLYGAGLFMCALFCHGELARLKPPPRHLTRFYLMLSLGSAIGAIAVGVVAPRIFAGYWELGIGLTLTALLAVVTLRRAFVLLPLAAVGVAGACAYFTYVERRDYRSGAHLLVRSFYGALRTLDMTPPDVPEATRQLIHGTIIHGQQALATELLTTPTAYYGPTSGVGRALATMTNPGRRIAMIGLGAGTIAAYGRAGDVIRFYEINPQVVDVARREFSFLGDSAATIEIALGDARLSLAGEPPQAFDLLAVDAFSGDAIPVHLLTQEAMAIYLRHLKPDGVMAFHVTNHFLNLAPVVKQIADANGLGSALIADTGETDIVFKSDWVLVTRNRAWLQRDDIAPSTGPIDDIPRLRPWTDDFNNLFQILQ